MLRKLCYSFYLVWNIKNRTLLPQYFWCKYYRQSVLKKIYSVIRSNFPKASPTASGNLNSTHVLGRQALSATGQQLANKCVPNRLKKVCLKFLQLHPITLESQLYSTECNCSLQHVEACNYILVPLRATVRPTSQSEQDIKVAGRLISIKWEKRHLACCCTDDSKCISTYQTIQASKD
jgi:hypothetical protein